MQLHVKGSSDAIKVIASFEHGNIIFNLVEFSNRTYMKESDVFTRGFLSIVYDIYGIVRGRRELDSMP